MKNLTFILLTGFAAAAMSAAAQDKPNPPQAVAAVPAAAQPNAAPPPGPPPGAPPAADQTAASAATNGAPPAATNQSAPIVQWSTNGAASGSLSNVVRMNFDKAPLTSVLNYLSDMYGFVITGDTGVQGKVSILANTPVDYKDAVDLLNGALTRDGYQAVLTGRTLTIMSIVDAKKFYGTRVFNDSNPTNIPVNETVVTQIIPVHSLNPTQLAKDLQALFPDRDTLTANEAGNSLIMTAPQSDVHHIAEIIQALDSTSVSDVKVFLLRYGDSKSVASELKDIFTDPNAQQNNMRNFMRMRFGGPPGGGGGGGGGEASSNPIRVNAVSDDQNNAVLVSAPLEVMNTVSNLINQLDQPSEDVTVLRVFHLKHADPTEMADELTTLFPDDTSSASTSDRTRGTQFFRGPFGRGAGGPTPAEPSDRMKRKSKVIAVAERRTGAVLVTASRDLMTQIASMVAELDQPDVHNEVVASIPISYADPSEVLTLMQDLFTGATARPSSATASTTAIQQRTMMNAQQQTSSSSTGFGGAGGGGGGTAGLH